MAKTTLFNTRLVLTIAFSASLSTSAIAQTDTVEPENNLDNLLCKDVMILAGIDRDTTIAFMHGYLTHKRRETVVDVERVEGSTAIFVEDCIEAPNDKAMATLEKALGN